ncbi:MAG: hypothetical protein GIX00_09445 [Candidatus Eremiobacteraeota bacterium]|nr:hypothetical protein [Candidatus Eremiobacteraeota bacterium]MBC5808812.1 hypothetical protein [Candidatus Eremiobacteraeota bacterium]
MSAMLDEPNLSQAVLSSYIRDEKKTQSATDADVAKILRRILTQGPKSDATQRIHASQLRRSVLRRDGFTCRSCGYGIQDSVSSVLVVVVRALSDPHDPKAFFVLCNPCRAGYPKAVTTVNWLLLRDACA